MKPVQPLVMNWGPAIVILFGILMGVLFNNARITDLRTTMDKRFDEQDKRFEARLTDLKDLIRSEVRRIEDRLERLERPIYRP